MRSSAENLRRARMIVMNSYIHDLPLRDAERAALELELVEIQRKILKIVRRIEEVAPPAVPESLEYEE